MKHPPAPWRGSSQDFSYNVASKSWELEEYTPPPSPHKGHTQASVRVRQSNGCIKRVWSHRPSSSFCRERMRVMREAFPLEGVAVADLELQQPQEVACDVADGCVLEYKLRKGTLAAGSLRVRCSAVLSAQKLAVLKRSRRTSVKRLELSVSSARAAVESVWEAPFDADPFQSILNHLREEFEKVFRV